MRIGFAALLAWAAIAAEVPAAVTTTVVDLPMAGGLQQAFGTPATVCR